MLENVVLFVLILYRGVEVMLSRNSFSLNTCNEIIRKTWYSIECTEECFVNTFAASYLNTQGLNNSCLKSRQRRP